MADTIVRTVGLGVRITDAALDGETTVLWCELVAGAAARCPGCGRVGVYRDASERRLTDLPLVGHPTRLRVRVPRFRCTAGGCERVVFTEAINGRLEALRRNALGFRNPINYWIRSLLHCGRFAV